MNPRSKEFRGHGLCYYDDNDDTSIHLFIAPLRNHDAEARRSFALARLGQIALAL
jgi:hypothetical protein